MHSSHFSQKSIEKPDAAPSDEMDGYRGDHKVANERLKAHTRSEDDDEDDMGLAAREKTNFAHLKEHSK